MSRTVTALYDTKAEAEAARERLCSAVDVDNVKVIDGQSQGSGNGLGDYYMSNDDRHAYGEGLRRGGALLCAEVDGDEDRDRIVQALEQTSSVDLEERQRGWQQEGWTPYDQNRQNQQQASTGSSQQFAGTGSAAIEEERIPIVEEELRVGKREVERGGARVRSYVREVPVQEEVTLREEHVQVERRPVEQSGGTASSAATPSGDMLQDRTIEMVERAEEAVVQKVANVREEVVVTKTAEERTEQIQDTVRRTEIDVEEGARGAGDRSAFGGFGGSPREGSER
jgi:uncharacterized protein (TIGR02271 family)